MAEPGEVVTTTGLPVRCTPPPARDAGKRRRSHSFLGMTALCTAPTAISRLPAAAAGDADRSDPIINMKPGARARLHAISYPKYSSQTDQGMCTPGGVTGGSDGVGTGEPEPGLVVGEPTGVWPPEPFV